jgi:hypothetical protein
MLMSMETPNTTYKNTFANFIEFLLIKSVFFISKKNYWFLFFLKFVRLRPVAPTTKYK